MVSEPGTGFRKDVVLMKRLFCLLLAVGLLLCGCVSTPGDQPATAPIQSDTTQSTGGTQVPGTSENQTPATNATGSVNPVQHTNPLTGEVMDGPMTNRPFAVMLNNIKAAMPQHGVSQADILYEILVEGNITRCMGIYSSLADVGALGSIRSARKYYVDLAQSYDAIYLHAGGSDEAYTYLNSIRCDHIDGVKGANASKYFYRDQDRLNAGYKLEHTMFITGQKAIEYATKQNCTLNRPQGLSYGLQFDDETLIVGTAAKELKVYFNMGATPSKNTKSTTLTYDVQTGKYFAAQFGEAYIDGTTKETIAFRNVLILKAKTSVQAGSNLKTVELIGSGTGYFACNGQLVPIKWSRASLNQPFVYTLQNGAPLTLGVGTTYIAITPETGVVEYQ